MYSIFNTHTHTHTHTHAHTRIHARHARTIYTRTCERKRACMHTITRGLLSSTSSHLAYVPTLETSDETQVQADGIMYT